MEPPWDLEREGHRLVLRLEGRRRRKANRL